MLHRVDPADDLLGERDLVLTRRPEREAALRGIRDGLQDRRVGVAEDHRAPGADQVDVGLAVHVGEPGAARGGHEARGAADRAEGADGAVDPAGDDGRRARHEGGGGGREVSGGGVGRQGRAHGPIVADRDQEPGARSAGSATEVTSWAARTRAMASPSAANWAGGMTSTRCRRTDSTWTWAIATTSWRPAGVSTSSTPRRSSRHDSRVTQPRFSSREAVWVTRLRDWMTRSARVDIRSRPPGASESIESSSYSERPTPCDCRSRSSETSRARLARR